MLSPRLHTFLDERHAAYTTIPHDRTFTAHETAAAARVDHHDFAKTVMLRVDGQLAMLVLPSAYRLDLGHLADALGGGRVALASEGEFKGAFPDCELGAMPPFGNLYGMPVYVDGRLVGDHEIAFNAGSHTEAVRMPYAEFAQLVQPRTVRVAYLM
jgi:Ala-tRNA(Pro) deacylase